MKIHTLFAILGVILIIARNLSRDRELPVNHTMENI